MKDLNDLLLDTVGKYSKNIKPVSMQDMIGLTVKFIKKHEVGFDLPNDTVLYDNVYKAAHCLALHGVDGVKMDDIDFLVQKVYGYPIKFENAPNGVFALLQKCATTLLLGTPMAQDIKSHDVAMVKNINRMGTIWVKSSRLLKLVRVLVEKINRHAKRPLFFHDGEMVSTEDMLDWANLLDYNERSIISSWFLITANHNFFCNASLTYVDMLLGADSPLFEMHERSGMLNLVRQGGRKMSLEERWDEMYPEAFDSPVPESLLNPEVAPKVLELAEEDKFSIRMNKNGKEATTALVLDIENKTVHKVHSPHCSGANAKLNIAKDDMPSPCYILLPHNYNAFSFEGPHTSPCSFTYHSKEGDCDVNHNDYIVDPIFLPECIHLEEDSAGRIIMTNGDAAYDRKPNYTYGLMDSSGHTVWQDTKAYPQNGSMFLTTINPSEPINLETCILTVRLGSGPFAVYTPHRGKTRNGALVFENLRLTY